MEIIYISSVFSKKIIIQNGWVFQKRNNQKGEGKKSKVEKSTSSADLLFFAIKPPPPHNYQFDQTNQTMNECNEQHSFICCRQMTMQMK